MGPPAGCCARRGPAHRARRFDSGEYPVAISSKTRRYIRFLSPLRRIRTMSSARIVALSTATSYMTSPDPAKNGSWLRQAKVKSITRAAMPVLIAARCSTTTKHIAGISFRHCRPRVILANARRSLAQSTNFIGVDCTLVRTPDKTRRERPWSRPGPSAIYAALQRADARTTKNLNVSNRGPFPPGTPCYPQTD